VGFVYQLRCPDCGFHVDHVGVGLGAGCAVVHALAQDTETGRLRELRVAQADVSRHSGRKVFRTDQEWVDALESCIAAMLAPTESAISPHQAVCPRCRSKLSVQDRGFM